MSSSTPSPSSSSPPSSATGRDQEGGRGGEEEVARGSGRRGGARVEEPSPSRQRSGDGVWPEPFLEALAVLVATDAAAAATRLAAAPAVVTLFQVCSTWREVSHSELLWQNLTRRIWLAAESRGLPTWRAEFARHHRTGRNFQTGNCTHALVPVGDAADPSSLTCRRLAVSARHLAAGYLDGSVRLFGLPSCQHLATFGPHPARDLLGPYSRSVSGLALDDASSRLLYASQDGDIHVAATDSVEHSRSRRWRVGNLVEDGTLVDFASSGRYCAGLFSGVPGKSVQVWNTNSEDLVFLGGSLTDPDALLGWHMLTELSDLVGRIRIADPKTLIGCTASRIQALDLEEEEEVGAVVAEEELTRAAVAEAVDACHGRVMVVDARGVATVRAARTLAEACRFNTAGRRGGRGARAGCLNWGYAVLSSAGRVRVWDVGAGGRHLYVMRERVGDGDGSVVVTASDRYVACWAGETGLLHLWDFGAL